MDFQKIASSMENFLISFKKSIYIYTYYLKEKFKIMTEIVHLDESEREFTCQNMNITIQSFTNHLIK